MQDFEKLDALRIGRFYDVPNKTSQEDLLLHDSKDLVTHSVGIGVTVAEKQAQTASNSNNITNKSIDLAKKRELAWD